MALTDSLISYWKLDEASGNALDAHGTNDLTDNNTVGSGTGKISGARDFESTQSEWLSHADNADLSTGDIDFTISCWVKFETLGNVIVAKWLQTASQRSYRIDYDSGTFRFLVSNNGTAVVTLTASTFGAASVGVWYFVTAWHDSVGNQIGIAINAGTPDTASHTTGTFDNTATFNIGAEGAGAAFFDGLIDEVGFWKRVLTSDERTELYNSGSGLAYPFTASSPSASPSASTSASPSTSPSSSPSSTPSSSPSGTPSASSSSSPSTSPSSTPSASPSASASSSASSTPSASTSASPSASASGSPSSSLSPSATPSGSPSTSPSGVGAQITMETSVFATEEGIVNVVSNRLLTLQIANEADTVFAFPETQVN